MKYVDTTKSITDILHQDAPRAQHKVDRINITGDLNNLAPFVLGLIYHFKIKKPVNCDDLARKYRYSKGVSYKNDGQIDLFIHPKRGFLCLIHGKALARFGVQAQFELLWKLNKSNFTKNITRVDFKYRISEQVDFEVLASKLKEDSFYRKDGWKSIYLPGKERKPGREKILFIYDSQNQHKVAGTDFEARFYGTTAKRELGKLYSQMARTPAWGESQSVREIDKRVDSAVNKLVILA